MTRTASTISFLLLLWVFTTGCESQPVQTRVHLRVFEIPTEVLRQHTPDRKLYKLSDSAYALSVITPYELDTMLSRKDARPRMLTDSTRVINDWPRVTDTWVYSPAYAGIGADSVCTGGGAGYLGARQRDGKLEVRLEYLVDHRGALGQKLVESKLFYEYYYPEGKVLLFHTPANVSGRIPRHHVIAFEAAREDSAPFRNGLYARKQPGLDVDYR